MVNRKTLFKGIFVEKEIAQEFEDLANDGETKTETMKRIINEYKVYKSKCLGHKDQGVIYAD